VTCRSGRVSFFAVRDAEGVSGGQAEHASRFFM